MPKLSDYVRRAEGPEKGGNSNSTRLEAAEAAPSPPRPLAPTTATTPAAAAASATTPRYRDRTTGKLLPLGAPPPPRPRAHVEARREWRGLVRYCCAAVSAATGGRAVPLPPDAGGDEAAVAGPGIEEEQEDELVPALEDPEAPWGAHYAALLKGVRDGGERG